MSQDGYILNRPEIWESGVIMASPHSGRAYPDWFIKRSRLGRHALRSSEDAFMDRLIASAPQAGAVTLCANVPRCLVDLNRARHELDPALIEGAAKRGANPRINAGLGVIPRVVAHGQEIHRSSIARDEAESWLARYWQPYHDALRGLIDEARAKFGAALIIDMHSMPHDALSHFHAPRPQVVLGNRHGASASAEVTAAVTSAVTRAGFRLRCNSPFSGAYVATAYGQPNQSVHVIQLEFDRSLYMDEADIRPSQDFDTFRTQMQGLIAELARIAPPRQNTGAKMAAE